MYFTTYIQNIVYYRNFRHIQAYCGIFRKLCNSCLFRTLPYSKSWHIYNLRYTQRSVKTYSGIFRTLCNCELCYNISELCHIQKFRIFRTRGIFKTLFYRHIQAYLGIFDNDSYNNITINFPFFYFNLTYFSAKRKKDICIFYYNDVNFNTRMSLLK